MTILQKVAVQPGLTEAVRLALAPTGVLRVGVYRGSPSSYLPDTDAERGVGFLMGRAFAEYLGVPFDPVVFPKNAEVLAALEHGRLDLVFTNATADRARAMDFSPRLLDVEKSVLVPPGSAYPSLESLRGVPARIGINVGSTTGAELAKVYPSARLIPVPTLQQAADMLDRKELDGFATNKAILFEVADKVPGSKVLAGAWGLEHFALGIPLRRDAGRSILTRFAHFALSSGLLHDAVLASRLRGTVAPNS
ncbi:transporter substrate-binding domain-containing protein [Xylophilus sp. GW821-FHT01B05]